MTAHKSSFYNINIADFVCVVSFHSTLTFTPFFSVFTIIIIITVTIIVSWNKNIINFKKGSVTKNNYESWRVISLDHDKFKF